MTRTEAAPPSSEHNPRERHAGATDRQALPPADAPWGDTLRRSAPGEAAQAASMRRTACAFAEHHDAARPGDVALAVGEAVANVVVHAYRDGARGPLHLTGFVDVQLVYVTVADEGLGLRPRTDSPGLGLGLPMIARVSDHFHVSDRQPTGTLVTMGFARTIPPDPAVAEDDLLGRLRDELAAAIEDGADMDGVQARIDGEALRAEARDALWLYAWSAVQLARRRHSGQNGKS